MKRIKKEEIFNIISESYDEDNSLKNENRVFSRIISVSMLVGAIASFFTRYFMYREDINTIISGSLTLLIVAVFFLVFTYLKNEVIKMYLNAILLSLLSIYAYEAFFPVIGPAISSVSFLAILAVLVYSRIDVLAIYLLTNNVFNIYMWYHLYEFDNWTQYYPAHVMITLTFSIAAISVFSVFRNRQLKIINHAHAMQLSEEKLYAILSSVGDGVISVDEKGIVNYLNPVAEKLTGWKLEEASSQHFDRVFNIINEFSREKVESPVKKVMDTKEVVELANHTLLISRTGEERPIEDTASPIRDKNNEIVGVVVIFRDFSEKKEKRKLMENLSYSDHLTGLYNRRYLEKALIRIDTSENLPISLVYADIDGLKMINDTFGHTYGDKLIQEVADGLKEEYRENDIIARTGGDEFIMILPKTDLETADYLLKKIKDKIDQKKIMNIDISVSFGVSTKYKIEQDFEKLLKEAEDLMYQRKSLESLSNRKEVIKSVFNNLLLKSPDEIAHSKNVAKICEDIARAYDLSDQAIDELKIAGELHDIGKIGMDGKLLNKRDDLTNEELEQVELHPETGYRLLNTTNEYYNISKYILSHHERWDGTGYPHKLKGEEIPWNSRVISIADAYDSMTTDRSYRPALSVEEAVQEIKKNAGSQFDPDISKVFVEEVLGFKW